MLEEQEAALCRIFIGEEDKADHHPLVEKIVDLARTRGIKGVTVLKGILGFGHHKHLHAAKVLRLSEDLPLVIEIVDQAEAIETFLTEVQPLIKEGMITMEKVKVRFIHP